MDFTAHTITDLIIETAQDRQHTEHSDPYQHIKIIAVDEVGNEMEVSLFSRNGKIEVHNTDNAREIIQDIRDERRQKKRAKQKAQKAEQDELIRLIREQARKEV